MYRGDSCLFHIFAPRRGLSDTSSNGATILIVNSQGIKFFGNGGTKDLMGNGTEGPRAESRPMGTDRSEGPRGR